MNTMNTIVGKFLKRAKNCNPVSLSLIIEKILENIFQANTVYKKKSYN